MRARVRTASMSAPDKLPAASTKALLDLGRSTRGAALLLHGAQQGGRSSSVSG